MMESKLKKIKSKWLFIFLVIVPTFLTSVYNILLATPIYISESKLVIKTVGDVPVSGFTALLKAFGAGDNLTSGASIVVAFTQSRDTMNLLNKQFMIKEYYSKRGDLLTRFNPVYIDDSDESFHKYYINNIVNAWVDTTSNILTLHTRAFDGETAYKINKELLTQAENFINLLNKRASLTAMGYYEEQIKRTKNKIDNASRKLFNFFKETGFVSSEAQIMSQVQIITELQKKLTERKLEYSKLHSLAPENPVLQTLKEDIKRIESEISSNFDTLTSKMGKHSVNLEIFKSEMQTLQAELNAHIQAYIHSQNQAFMKHLFIETVQSPTFPDKALEPKELRNIFTVFVISFALWGIISLLVAGIREHRGV